MKSIKRTFTGVNYSTVNNGVTTQYFFKASIYPNCMGFLRRMRWDWYGRDNTAYNIFNANVPGFCEVIASIQKKGGGYIMPNENFVLSGGTGNPGNANFYTPGEYNFANLYTTDEMWFEVDITNKNVNQIFFNCWVCADIEMVYSLGEDVK